MIGCALPVCGIYLSIGTAPVGIRVENDGVVVHGD
jgi:hypothetical protein